MVQGSWVNSADSDQTPHLSSNQDIQCLLTNFPSKTETQQQTQHPLNVKVYYGLMTKWTVFK